MNNRILRDPASMLIGNEWVDAIMYQDGAGKVFIRPARSAWTGNPPRSMSEAFGPGASLQITQPGQRERPWHWLVWAAVIVVLSWTLLAIGGAR